MTERVRIYQECNYTISNSLIQYALVILRAKVKLGVKTCTCFDKRLGNGWCSDAERLTASVDTSSQLYYNMYGVELRASTINNTCLIRPLMGGDHQQRLCDLGF